MTIAGQIIRSIPDLNYVSILKSGAVISTLKFLLWKHVEISLMHSITSARPFNQLPNLFLISFHPAKDEKYNGDLIELEIRSPAVLDCCLKANITWYTLNTSYRFKFFFIIKYRVNWNINFSETYLIILTVVISRYSSNQLPCGKPKIFRGFKYQLL